MRLTDISIRALKAPEKGAKIYPCDQISGFGVRVSQAGTASFVLTYGPARERVTLGRVGVISLKDARTAARERLAEETLGRHRPKRMSFGEALAVFVAEKEKKNRSRTIRENERILRKYFVSLHGKQLSDIRTHDLTRITDKLAGTPGTALHSFWTLRTFLRWCEGRRYIDDSPLRGVEAPTAVVFRDRVLTDAEFKAIIGAAHDSGAFGTLVLMLAYTGQRRTEISNLARGWFNEQDRLITLPSWICKNRREHVFPYGDLIAGLLDSLPKSGLLFPSDRGTPWSNFSKAKIAFDQKCGVTDWVLHDLRRSFATTLQRSSVRREVTEALLNHVSGTRAGIVGVYQRHDWMPEMRDAVRVFEAQIRSLLRNEENTSAANS